uniref:Uncharacterized protein n=1 Tax=Oryzias melastigma TaxID=30732 RepID=A0A3B3DWD1_ORYME
MRRGRLKRYNLLTSPENSSHGGLDRAKVLSTVFSDPPEDVVFVLEGVQVLSQVGSGPLDMVMTFALVYSLSLSYPAELKYTSEDLKTKHLQQKTTRPP